MTSQNCLPTILRDKFSNVSWSSTERGKVKMGHRAKGLQSTANTQGTLIPFSQVLNIRMTCFFRRLGISSARFIARNNSTFSINVWLKNIFNHKSRELHSKSTPQNYRLIRSRIIRSTTTRR
eukprot:TRINITY_DN37049_c0_g1_i1.p2 TRINITY_DN37049_c0_g1~~TRINITY_DN37049_c0_g1_i1.p2  ORF type:complete len:122 (-),score=6.67 TRINITY_DN37049_c0_g1_i1:332-697(-)